MKGDCQKSARSEPRHWRFCSNSPPWEVLPAQHCPLHFPATAEHQHAGILGSFLWFNSKGSSSIHQCHYFPGISNWWLLLLFFPSLALPGSPAHGISHSPVPQVSFPFHPSYRALISSGPICTVFHSHSLSVPIARSLLLALSPAPKKSCCSNGTWSKGLSLLSWLAFSGVPIQLGKHRRCNPQASFSVSEKTKPMVKVLPPGAVLRMEQAKSKAGPWHI